MFTSIGYVGSYACSSVFFSYFQVTESDAVDVVEKVVKDPRVKPETRAIALTALLKLSSRFPVCTGLDLYSTPCGYIY